MNQAIKFIRFLHNFLPYQSTSKILILKNDSCIGSITFCLWHILVNMVKCNSSSDCFYSPSIKYCKEPSAVDISNGITEGQCEWTWGIWAVLALFIAMIIFISILCIICIKRHGRCTRLTWMETYIMNNIPVLYYSFYST